MLCDPLFGSSSLLAFPQQVLRLVMLWEIQPEVLYRSY